MNADVRAPRLTEKVLTEDLPELLILANAEIEYLNDALAREDGGRIASADLRNRFTQRASRLQRARAWVQGKVDAEVAKRQDAERCPQKGCPHPVGARCDFPNCPGPAVDLLAGATPA